MTERETKRVHISGLNPTQCSLQDLRSRFDSFQLQVSDIYNWPPGKDAVDNVQNWCFLTLEGESSKIKRAMQVLNGTVWKGSKLRIGAAKDGGRSSLADSSGIGVDSVIEEKEKKVKRKSRRVESESIHIPIQPKDIDEGLWGWYKTPAGHMVRPIHMRPDHPLPRPGVRPNGKSGEESEKRKRRSATSVKPVSRAKRVTLDPSRYGSVHLSGLMLDDGNSPLPKEYEWVCEDVEDGEAEWNLKDSEGSIIKTERVPIAKHRKNIVADDEMDDDDDDSVMRDLGDALDNASSASLSEEEGEDKEDAEMEVLTLLETKEDDDLKLQDDAPYDPAEESDFSEGYQEMQSESVIGMKPWQEEKEGQIGLLKKMFGTLPEERVTPVSKEAYIANPETDDSDKEEAEQGGVAAKVSPLAEPQKEAIASRAEKRAALLNSLTANVKSQSFKPIVRFDPGVSITAEEEVTKDVTMPSMSGSTAVKEIDATEERQEDEEIPQVQMASLKDMFRPKEDTAGFSLLADLDLDLEEESEEEDEEESIMITAAPVNGTAPRPSMTTSVQAPPSNVKRAPLFFPTFDAEDKSWLGILQNDSSLKPFCRDQTDEEIQAIWNERKRTLTQEYKRRHREALKKKKRRFTGSRAATNSLNI